MKLYVNEKLFSLHRKFYIKDENDNDVYEISSQVISIGAKTTINDMQGNKVAYIEQEILHLTPHYNVYINDALAFKITKKFKLFKNDYELSNGYRVDGKVMMFNFDIFDENNNQIGCVTRKFFTIGDKYEIDIFDETKKDVVLAIIVAITNDVNRAQSSSNSNT